MLTAAPTIGSRLVAVGAAQPGTVVSADQLGRPFGRSSDWVRSRTGIRALRRLGPGEDLVPYAVAAGRQSLAQVPDVVPDLVITASCSIEASDHERIAAELVPTAARAAVNAACSGFSYAVANADALIRTGNARHVLIVAAEQMSRLLDAEDLGTSILFGDGAGSALIGPADCVEVGPVVWGSDGEAARVIECDDSGRLRMAGREVFRWAVQTVPQLVQRACDRAGVELAAVDVLVAHQANLRILDAVASKLGLTGVVVDDVVWSGNTSAASVPIALARALETGRVKSGQLAVLAGFGAGLSYAAQVVRIP